MKSINRFLDKRDYPYITIVTALGFVNHFLYNWTGHSSVIALFCPVNESVWEHLKLLFFPFLFASVLAYLRRKSIRALFFHQRLLAILSGMAVIIMLFYTYTGMIGRSFLLLDILIYLFGVLTAFSSLKCIRRKHSANIPSDSAVLVSWLFLCLCFFLFTGFPPNMPLFFSAQ